MLVHTHPVHLLRRRSMLAVVENMWVEGLRSGAWNVLIIVRRVSLVVLGQHPSTYAIALLLE